LPVTVPRPAMVGRAPRGLRAPRRDGGIGARMGGCFGELLWHARSALGGVAGPPGGPRTSAWSVGALWTPPVPSPLLPTAAALPVFDGDVSRIAGASSAVLPPSALAAGSLQKKQRGASRCPPRLVNEAAPLPATPTQGQGCFAGPRGPTDEPRRPLPTPATRLEGHPIWR